MKVYKGTAEVEVRDRRLKTIIAYDGSGKQLLAEAATGHVRCPGRGFSQCSDCAEGCSESMTLNVRDAAVVSHAPLGCMTDVSAQNVRERSTAEIQGAPPARARIISSNIQEKDTVYGAAQKLRAAIREADRRFRPKTIFVLSSCAAGIIGEDIESISSEMESELGYPVVPVYCEGFKSKTWSSGFDAGYHAILRKLVPPPRKTQPDLVNMFNFQDKDVFTDLFKRIGLRINLVLPMTTTIKNIAQLSEAACSAHICETLATYIAASLEELYGVPEVKTPPPYGLDWTDRWLREIGRLTHREEAVEQVIAEERERIAAELADLRAQLAGKTIYIVAGDTYAYNLANLVKDLGLQVVGLNMLHHDLHPDTAEQAYLLQEFTAAQGDMQRVSVCNKQPYRIVKLLRELQPDFVVVRHPGLTSFGTKVGIPTILETDANASSGYEGVLNMGRRLLRGLRSHRFTETVARHARLPYSHWWLNEGQLYPGRTAATVAAEAEEGREKIG